MELYDASELYPGFEYPAGIKRVVELGLTYLGWWWILEAGFACDYTRKMLPNVLHSRRMSGLLPRLGRPRAGAAGGWGPKTSLCSWSRR